MAKFTMREAMPILVVVALTSAWWRDHRVQKQHIDRLKSNRQYVKHLERDIFFLSVRLRLATLKLRLREEEAPVLPAITTESSAYH